MTRPKRKRTGADAAVDVEPASLESSPPKKRARRLAKSIVQALDLSDTEVQAVSRKSRRPTEPLSNSESSSLKKARRVKPPPPVIIEDSDSQAEGPSDSAASPRKRRVRPTVIVPSDSEEDGGNVPPKRLRRVKSPPLESENDSPTESPRKGRLHRKREDSAAEHILDSDDDPEDLALPVQPTFSRPTKKQINSAALERYAKARKNKSSPAPVPADAVDDDEDGLFREFTPIPEIEDEDEDEDVEEGVDNEEESFIVEEDEGDADADANAALDRMRYSHRELDEHFAVFVEYIVALDSDPEYMSTATEDEKEYFTTAVTALRRHIDSLADSMTLSTWKAPFIATLNLRPVLADGVSCEGNDNCHACWTRGMYSCDVRGSYTLSTKKGIYDPNTFQDLPEKKMKYGKATSFENNAEARNLPYPPRFELIVGARCFNRALAYHEARHSLYSASVRVKEKIQSLSEENAELANDPNALLEVMKEEDFINSLWGRFKADKKQWAHFGNRKDHDSLV
ncbi:hypothetical protein B0H17DRAFT_1079621 [Mycena rosella]|uniref:DUF4211 domain-containing protein n=1 Tax=Mycena rosella TaxID=1033263 RepID=A0AAD7GAU1_MYCRO|nr:hypothetical protein B0H17DRAFT_1079621 [Mycena rosella]